MATGQAASRHPRSIPFIVSFSGIDGAGKSTQIANLMGRLGEAGIRVRLIEFWDEIAAFRRVREAMSGALFRGETGIGTPDRPIRRRDKNVQSWYMLPLRMGFCIADSCRLATAVAEIRRRAEFDVVLFDRYIYDQMANLDTSKGLIRRSLRLLLKFVPKPEVAYLLDADPGTARARKPEYPLEFLRAIRERYRIVSAIADMTLIPPGAPDEVGRAIFASFPLPSAGNQGWREAEVLTSTSD